MLVFSFLDYPVVGNLADDRFADPLADVAERRRRARIVANLLCYSTRFYLDTIRQSGHGITFETSQNQDNGVLDSPYQSVLHMILNPPFLHERVVGLVNQGQAIARL